MGSAQPGRSVSDLKTLLLWSRSTGWRSAPPGHHGAMLDFDGLLAGLAESRRVFHSEADFQHALAWHIHQTMPSSQVRLEVDPMPLGRDKMYFDVWLPTEDVAIELKYATRGLQVEQDGELFALRNHGAQDIKRYDFLRDIARLEAVVLRQDVCQAGYAVLLTNDSLLWRTPQRRDTVDADFRVHEGREVSGAMDWADHTGSGTRKGRESPIELQGSYRLHWQEYSSFPDKPYGSFRYLLVSVER